MIDTRARLLEFLGLSIAHDDMGIYPHSVRGGSNPYEKRSEWQEGWNAYAMALTGKWSMVSRWLDSLPSDLRTKIEDLLLEDRLSLSISETSVQAYVNCNDLFYWGCADAEDISLEEIPDLVKSLEESPHGDELWVCRKRKMRPQRPCYKLFSEEDAALFDAAGPPRED